MTGRLKGPEGVERETERVWQCQDGAPEWYAEIVVEPFGLCLIGVYVSREAAEEAIERTRVSDWSDE